MFEKLIFDPVERQRARRIETKRLQVAGEHLHRRDAALLDRGDEFAARRERKIGPAPKTEALRISEVLHGRRAGGRHINDARVRQRMLEPQSRASLLRRLLVAAPALATCGIRSEEHTSELQSLMRISYAVFCLK